MKKTKGYYLGKLIALGFMEVLWIILLFSVTYKLFSLSYLTIILFTIILIINIPFLMDSISIEANHFKHILRQ